MLDIIKLGNRKIGLFVCKLLDMSKYMNTKHKSSHCPRITRLSIIKKSNRLNDGSFLELDQGKSQVSDHKKM